MVITKKYILILAAALMIFAAGCNQQESVKGQASSISEVGDIENVKVTSDKLDVRQGCSEGAKVMQTVDKDTVLQVLNKVTDWYAVELSNDEVGFVPQDQVKPIVVDDKKPESQPGTQTGTSETAPQPGAQTGAGDAGQENAPQIPDNTQTNNNTLTAEESEMLRLVNEARSQNNASPLEIDMELTNVARTKSQDMIENNYFSHNSPTYGSPFDMMKSFGIKYVSAGENIAGNQSVQSAHESLMNSPGHRKNILSPDFTHIGIGIRNGGTYGKMFTQMFISKPK